MKFNRIWPMILALGLILGGVLWSRRQGDAAIPVTPRSPLADPVVANQAVTKQGQVPALFTNQSSTHLPPTAYANYPDFNLRPLAVDFESDKVQWSLADGRETNVIRKLAHNPLEYERMVAENPKIYQRQLVYLKETAATRFEQAKLTGQPVQSLILPGLDGQELSFEIMASEPGGSSRHGQFSGRLAGNRDSLVTMAFQDGREAFMAFSPKDHLYVVGEPREDNQMIIKAIDPTTYGVGPTDSDDFVPVTTAK